MNLSFLEQAHQAITGLCLTPGFFLMLVPGSHTPSPCHIPHARGPWPAEDWEWWENGVRRAWLKAEQPPRSHWPHGWCGRRRHVTRNRPTQQPHATSRGNASRSLGALHGHFTKGWSCASRTPGGTTWSYSCCSPQPAPHSRQDLPAALTQERSEEVLIWTKW